MRVGLRFLIGLVPVLALVVWSSLRVLDTLERTWLSADLDAHASTVAVSTAEVLIKNVEQGQVGAAARLLNRIGSDERLAGAVVCRVQGGEFARSEINAELVSLASCEESWLKANAKLTLLENDGAFARSVRPLIPDGGNSPIAYLVLVHDTGYMANRHKTTRAFLITLIVGLALAFVGGSLLLYRFVTRMYADRLKKTFSSLMTGNATLIEESLKRSEFAPLVGDLSKVIREMRHSKSDASESRIGVTWTPVRLRSEVQKYFGDSRLCVIANREPYIHVKKGNKIEVRNPASGLVTAVEPIVRACSGLWIAHGGGNADRETADPSGKLLVPPDKPEYALKRVWLTKAEEQGYYYGFSNEGLWPLCHIAYARPHFDSRDWNQYVAVNEKFARAFEEEHKDEAHPIVMIQDYHFALLPKLIRARKPDAVLTLFWHIPWSHPESFGICPWKKELLEGMLAADLIGFHTQHHCNNFLDTVDRFLEARVDRDNFSVIIQGHTCYVKPFSIGVEWPPRDDLALADFGAERADILKELNLPSDVKLGIGVDRVDYTKGLIERLEAVERMLEQHPEWVGKFTFVQIGAPSRTHIKRYQDLNVEVQELADRINEKFGNADVPPIMLKLEHHNTADLYRYYRASDVCMVTSLHDGMNLVAKEYIAAHKDDDGVLILSTFAGASRELTDALLINPYDLDECGEALFTALTMPEDERRERMQRMRQVVAERNVFAWAGALMAETHRIAYHKMAPSGSG